MTREQYLQNTAIIYLNSGHYSTSVHIILIAQFYQSESGAGVFVNGQNAGGMTNIAILITAV